VGTVHLTTESTFLTSDLRQREYWAADLGHREYNHPVVQSFSAQRVRYIAQFLDLRTVKNALDVGCGNGFSTDAMSHYIPDIWGIDRSGYMLSRHPMRMSGHLSLGDALSLPFADNSFDLVYGWEILHHLSDPGPAVIEIARVSRRYVLLAEPNRNNPAQALFALIDREHRWVLRYNLPYMRRLFQRANLKIEHAGSGGWIFPNVTPSWLLPLLRRLPYRFPLGISNWVLGSKKHEE
jgi:SAM-dependent methyltransferase